jgi:hypothetical protein
MTVAMPILESDQTKLIFALRLRDGVTFEDSLAGDVSVAAGPRSGLQKSGTGTFVFFDLPNGATTFNVRSTADAPYYCPADISVTLPSGSALWPAYPDNGLADPSLPLSSPSQPAAFRTQFLACALAPDIAYPFDPSATLLRGVVMQGATPVAGAKVFDVAGNALPFVTGEGGEFVLLFAIVPSASFAATVRTQRQGQPNVDTAVTIQRATTSSVQINV